MNTNKKTAKIVGALFLTAMAASLLGGGLVESIISSPETLRAVSENETLLIAGALLELVNAIAVLGIGVMMFPILRPHSPNTALGYLGLRIIEAVFCSILVISPISLLALSQETALADAALSAASALLMAQRASIGDLLIPVFFSLGALLFYASAFQSRILPRPLAAWGLIGAALIITSTLLLAFDYELSMSAQMIFALPIILNEIFLGIWLMVKGFNSPAVDARMAWQTATP